MRRIAMLIVASLLVLTMICGVSAATQAGSVGAYATVSQDSSCQITLTAMLHIEQATEDLSFPVPKDARNITLNGSRVRTQTQGDTRLISLSRILGGLTGDFSITVNYTLDNAVHTTEENLLQLQVPLLSGFAYPVQSLEFSVTLPGEVSAKPSFSSGYHQANIEKDLTYNITGAVITGATVKPLKDHETLAMTLLVSEEMFPQTGVELPDMNALNVAVIVCAVLAGLYWLLFLRCAPPRFFVSPAPPEGCTAGELGSVLTLQGADLTGMVFTWAQLGYILIHIDRHNHVTLHKRMDMGNERSGFEQRCFKILFGKRSSVDTRSTYYASLSSKLSKQTPNLQSYIRPRSGNPKLFRALAATAGLLGGVSVGIALSTGAALQWLLIILVAVLGGISSWLIHRWAYSLFQLDKRGLWLGLGLCGAWLLLSAVAGLFQTGLWIVILQLLAGLMAAYGGRRTEEGRQTMSQILALRRYLCTVNRQELQRLTENNPEYFHTLAPYALALGVDKVFAKRFGGIRLTGCPYLTTGMDGHMTAAEWSNLMRCTVTAMEERRRGQPKEKLLRLIRSFVR